uniref:Uncharacterized protein TCIL3000_11_12450 n=1 Tax=Trypanosoma congolense (strain IL3000) TaxID=1068625 RepID=G0V277_TRYCI|nr:unnamed protein product [Trypanosoma congolense IL3000]
MAATGSREEMMQALNKARQAMARRLPVSESADNAETSPDDGSRGDLGVLQVYDIPETALHRQSRISEAKDNRAYFFETWCRKIEMFIADPTKTTMELPADLCANDRRELHTLAEKYNLSHHSRDVGAARHLVLKKDALHYRMPDAAPEDIESIKRDAGTKESKFHLRRVRQDPNAPAGSLGAFGDEATAAMVHRLARATDEYRKAVNVGYSQEELLAQENGESIERILCRPEEQHGRPTSEERTGCPSGLCITPPQKTVGVNVDPTAHPKSLATDGNVGVVYDEMCLRCKTRSRVEYDIQNWNCNGYCKNCAAHTVWRLVEVEGNAMALGAQLKRAREECESGAVVPSSEPMRPEEIDKDNDEDDTITVEDVVDMASMNDFSAADVNWIRAFAVHHSSKANNGALSSHIVFCIEFNDLLTMRIFRHYLNQEERPSEDSDLKRVRSGHETSSDVPLHIGSKEAWFVKLREVRTAGVALSTLLDELADCTPERYDRLCVAFPNMSVYGTAASCICLIQPGFLKTGSLEAMQRKYGKENFCFARALGAILGNDSLHE